VSADKIAEIRARRILLDERLSKLRKGRDRMNDTMFEVFVRGSNVPLEVERSPFPALYRDLKSDQSLFLAAARLVGVLWLRLSGTVEHIFQLDFRMDGDAALTVEFEGQRQRQYSNHEPAIIRVDGKCPLA
jgi:hypothetical protein